jgi:hypothetical protein
MPDPQERAELLDPGRGRSQDLVIDLDHGGRPLEPDAIVAPRVSVQVNGRRVAAVDGVLPAGSGTWRPSSSGLVWALLEAGRAALGLARRGQDLTSVSAPTRRQQPYGAGSSAFRSVSSSNGGLGQPDQPEAMWRAGRATPSGDAGRAGPPGERWRAGAWAEATH